MKCRSHTQPTVGRPSPIGRRWLVALGAWACTAIAAALFATDAVAQLQGVNAMSDLRISLELPDDRWVVGTPYRVKVRLHNEGTAPAEVPTTLSPSEFEFRFSSAQLARVLSGKARRLSRRPDPAPVPRFVEPLAAGAIAEYTENLAEYAQPALPPGSYQLTVRWSRGVAGKDSSPTATVQVVAPRVGSLATAADASGTLAVLWADERGTDQIVLMQREGARSDPAAGAASERVTLRTATAPALALTVSQEDNRGVRWSAWIDGVELGTRLAQGDTVFAAPQPLPLPLAIGKPRLHPIGWQPQAETAFFLVLGDSVAERVALAVVTQPVDDDASIRVAWLETGGPVLRWAAQWRPPAGEFTVVTAAVVPGGLRVVAHTVAGDAQVTQSRTLSERAEALLALALAPLAGTGAGHVDLIFGPSAGSPPSVGFLRLPLDGGPPLIEVPVLVPVDAAGQPATDWALAPTEAAPPRLLARLGDLIIGKFLSAGGRGFVLTRDAAGARELRLVKLGDAWWAVWIDPTLGLRYARLPDLA